MWLKFGLNILIDFFKRVINMDVEERMFYVFLMLLENWKLKVIKCYYVY